uniref:ARID domain-containing protein n=1 Tax=Bursaphelenchus xylophilus TaxID=6326 RepID=A0A1I7SR77_BURXY
MDPSRNQFFPNSFQGNISNQLNPLDLNQGSNVNLMQTLSQLSNLANSNLNSTAMGQDMLNRGYLSQNLGNQYLNNGGLNNGVNWNQQQSQDWLDTAKVAAMYNIIQSSVNPTNVNNQFGSPTNFLSTPSSNLFNQPRAELPSVPNSEISMFSNQSSASLTPSMQSSLADNGFGTYNFNPLPSTSASQDLQPALSQQIDADALSEFLDIRSNDFLAGSSSLGNNLQEFNNSTYNQEPLIPKTSFQSAASLSYNNDLPTTYAEPVTQSATSQRNDDPMIGSQHFDQSPYQTNASRTPKQHFEGATTSRFQENTHLFNEDLSNVDLLDLAEKLNKYEEELNAGSDTRQDIGSHDVNNVNSATTYDEYLAASSEQTSHRTDNWSISRLEHDKNVDDQTHPVTESQGEHGQREATHYSSQCVQSCEAVKERPAVEEDPDAMPENFLEEPMERKSSMEMADELSVSVSNAKPQLDSSAVVSATDAKTTSEAQVKSSVPKDDAVVTKEEEVDQTGTALIDFLNGMAGGTERDSPEPMANPSFEPVQFTPPDSPTAPAAPSFQQSAPSFSSFPSFGVLGFTPSTNLGLQPSSSKLVSFLPEVKSETKEPLLSNSMFNVKKNELIKELPKKIPIYKQDMDLKEEKEDKKKAGGNVYDFDEDEFGFDLKPAESKFKKDEPMSTKPTLPTSVYKPIKPKTQSSNHSKTKPLRIKIRPIEPPPDNTTCIQVLQKELEASSEPIKISPFGDIDISVNPTPKAWRWDSDPNENTKLEVVVKEEDQSERPSLKLTIKMTKKEPTSYFEEPEEKSKKKRKHSESEDEEDEYLPSACRKHKKKKKRRMSFKEIDPLDDLDR